MSGHYFSIKGDLYRFARLRLIKSPNYRNFPNRNLLRNETSEPPDVAPRCTVHHEKLRRLFWLLAKGRSVFTLRAGPFYNPVACKIFDSQLSHEIFYSRCKGMYIFLCSICCSFISEEYKYTINTFMSNKSVRWWWNHTKLFALTKTTQTLYNSLKTTNRRHFSGSQPWANYCLTGASSTFLRLAKQNVFFMKHIPLDTNNIFFIQSFVFLVLYKQKPYNSHISQKNKSVFLAKKNNIKSFFIELFTCYREWSCILNKIFSVAIMLFIFLPFAYKHRC